MEWIKQELEDAVISLSNAVDRFTGCETDELGFNDYAILADKASNYLEAYRKFLGYEYCLVLYKDDMPVSLDLTYDPFKALGWFDVFNIPGYDIFITVGNSDISESRMFEVCDRNMLCKKEFFDTYIVNLCIRPGEENA